MALKFGIVRERGLSVATQRKYVINEAGKKTAVVPDMKGFERMRLRLEDLEDALGLKRAVSVERGFRDLRDIQAEERAPGRRPGNKK